MDQQEYNYIMGLDTEDVGSRRKLLVKVLSYAKKRGYPQRDFRKMKKYQLKGIFYNHYYEENSIRVDTASARA
jgi:hypothetical protein